MKCQHEKCALHEDCGFLEIFSKEPKSAEACSYFRSHIRAENKNKNLTESEKKKLRRS
jgi:hypothetical protein